MRREWRTPANDDWDRPAVQFLRNNRADNKNGIRVAQNNSGRRGATTNRFGKNGATGTGSPADRHDDDPLGELFAACWMRTIHDSPRMNIKAAPETEWSAQVKRVTFGSAIDKTSG